MLKFINIYLYEFGFFYSNRGFPETMESGLAASPRQARQHSQPSTIEPEEMQAELGVPPAEAALPTSDSVQPPEADQAEVEAEALQADMPMPINVPVHPSEADEVQNEPPSAVAAISDESFLAGVRWQRQTESAQIETE